MFIIEHTSCLGFLFNWFPLKENFLICALQCLVICFLTFIYQDIAGTLATEEAEDAAQVAKLRSALESVDHKRRKVLDFAQLLFFCAPVIPRNFLYCISYSQHMKPRYYLIVTFLLLVNYLVNSTCIFFLNFCKCGEGSVTQERLPP